MCINPFKVYWPRTRNKQVMALVLFSLFTCALWLSYTGKISPSSYLKNSPQYYLLPSQIENYTGAETELVTNQISNKSVILMWSKYYRVEGETLMRLIYSGKKSDPNCCLGVEITLDRSRLEDATAVVIYHYYGNLEKTDLPPTRKPGQLWVLFAKECPRMSPSLKPFNKLFNLTMTYRRDSDIWCPYGETLKLEKPLGQNETITIGNVSLDTLISGKTKLLAGAISHCKTDSKREKVIERMKKEGNISIDIYGACGIQTCPRLSHTCNPNELWEKVAQQYKFYFAAENTICIDYITEKFWRSLNIGVVPVVYGGGNYSFEAPPGSFIDARNFKSPLDLVRFLQKLDKEPGEYKKYFEWRRNYSVRATEGWYGWCNLCKHITNFTKALDSGISSQVSKINFDKLDHWWLHTPRVEGESVKRACSKPLWNT